MKIQVNNQPLECKDDAVLADVATLLDLPAQGVAVAVNNKMVPRAQWPYHAMEEGDSLVVVRASCGG